MTVDVRAAAAPADWASAERLIRAYIDSLPFDMSSFQDLDREMTHLSEEYGPPSGRALLASVDGADVGFAGMRRFDEGIAELKRMYVDPPCRGAGVGRALAVAAVDAARALGYRRLVLDTVSRMTAAIAIYEGLGFTPIPPYRHNPLPDAAYFALDL
ncbi:MAG: GNAT family N-acetyltransferase [Acidimicrobiales bacterium]|nr:GNAT family N-acetyltransferase [Acidimicrobiales bacterium]